MKEAYPFEMAMNSTRLHAITADSYHHIYRRQIPKPDTLYVSSNGITGLQIHRHRQSKLRIRGGPLLTFQK
jgi:hypothetical protein